MEMLWTCYYVVHSNLAQKKCEVLRQEMSVDHIHAYRL